MLRSGRSGGFVGVDAGVARRLVRLKASALADRQTTLSVGVDAGFRFELAGGVARPSSYFPPFTSAFTYDEVVTMSFVLGLLLFAVVLGRIDRRLPWPVVSRGAGGTAAGKGGAP